ncbi:sensor histidine kinase, partial [Mucilaginibacter polytrichastri]
TPLTTIKGLVQVMQKIVPPDVGDKFKSILNKTGIYIDRLNNLIAELLDMSRIQSGNIELHKEYFDFDKIIYETVDVIQTATKSHDIVIEGRTGENVLADESHIIQVINNLLSNAIKYSPDQKAVIIHLSRVSNFLKFSIKDEGVGINMEDQKKIFDRFFRVGEVQQRFPGMGIGLYICDQIIKNHGGSLWVESEPGKGSTFNFTLPLAQNHDRK